MTEPTSADLKKRFDSLKSLSESLTRILKEDSASISMQLELIEGGFELAKDNPAAIRAAMKYMDTLALAQAAFTTHLIQHTESINACIEVGKAFTNVLAASVQLTASEQTPGN